jgi:hypothetical protein
MTSRASGDLAGQLMGSSENEDGASVSRSDFHTQFAGTHGGTNKLN